MKPYKCGFHKCEQVCHSGECGECPRSLVRTCPCGKSSRLLFINCVNIKYSFKVISVNLASQKPCNVEIGPCGDTCDKKLECNIHKCINRCHLGPCEQVSWILELEPPNLGVLTNLFFKCRQVVVKKCRCGQKEKSMPCYMEFLCESKCNRMKACGKHKCNKKVKKFGF